MSGYSIYVWVGDMPTRDPEALATSLRLWDEHGAASEQPAPELMAYLRDLTGRHPRVIDPNLMGPFLYVDIPFAAMEGAYPDIV